MAIIPFKLSFYILNNRNSEINVFSMQNAGRYAHFYLHKI